MLFQPENLRGRETGQDGVAQRANGFLQPAKPLRDFVALRGGGGVAPQFRRANDLACLIQRHKPVLLPAHADGFHLGGNRFGLPQRPANRAGGGLAPGVRMLFLRAGGQIRNQFVFLDC